ncbi:hypothetical protein ACLOJK_018798 [Asimina triloba]
MRVGEAARDDRWQLQLEAEQAMQGLRVGKASVTTPGTLDIRTPDDALRKSGARLSNGCGGGQRYANETKGHYLVTEYPNRGPEGGGCFVRRGHLDLVVPEIATIVV